MDSILFTGVIRRDGADCYSLSFPDFPGLQTKWKSQDKAEEMAVAGLTCHFDTMIEYEEQIPKPSNIEDIVTDSRHGDAVSFIIVPVNVICSGAPWGTTVASSSNASSWA